jgi:LemA protein
LFNVNKLILNYAIMAKEFHMKTFGMICAVLVVIAIAIGGWYMGTYNTIINLDENINEAAGNIDTDLQRRYDLIPNLVASVKGIMKHEKDVFVEVTEARSKASQMNISMAGMQDMSPAEMQTKMQQFAGAQSGLNGALSKLMVVMEKYPDIKANQNVTQLMDELAGTENRVAISRKRYNESVTNYNKKIRSFLGSIVADKMGMEKKVPFKVEAAAKVAPKVDLSL